MRVAESATAPNPRQRTFVFLVGLALCIRLIAFAGLQMWSCTEVETRCGLYFYWDDADQYHAIAKGLANSGTFDAHTNVVRGGDQYEWQPVHNGHQLTAHRVPGYPLFLWPLYELFPNSHWVAFIAQAFLDALSCGLVFLVGLEAFRHRRAAILAAIFYAVGPIPVHYSQRLIAETLFTFLFTLSLYLCIRALRDDRWKSCALAGFGIGACALVKPIALYYGAIPAIFMAFHKRSRRTKALRIGALLISTMLTITPWMARNLHEFGHFKLSNASGNTLCWQASLLNQEQFADDLTLCLGSSDWRYANDGPFELAAAAQRRALQRIEANFFRFSVKHLQGTLKLHLPIETKNWRMHDRSDVSTTALAHAMQTIEPFFKWVIHPLVLTLAAIGCLIALRRKQHRPIAIFFGVTIAYFVGAAGALGNLEDTARFRLPVIPLYMIFASTAVYCLFERLHHRLKRMRQAA